MPQNNGLKKLIVLIVFLSFPAIGFAQDLPELLREHTEKYTSEKIHIHFDKSKYLPGDTIWYKVYAIENGLPAVLSKHVYIDFLDNSGDLIERRGALLSDGVAWGQLNIPDNYSFESINVRAYTLWMLNFGAEALYQKSIPIIFEQKDKETPLVTLTFFPESGDLVHTIKTKVAFKANDQWGRPVDVIGVVKDKSENFIDSVKSIHQGMGYFFIKPELYNNYALHWTDQNRQDYFSALPDVKTEGANLSVASYSHHKTYTFQLSENLRFANTHIHLVGTLNNQVVFSVTKNVTNEESKGEIPIKDLPSGILTLTLFDQHWTPLAERISFINHQEYRAKASVVVKENLEKRAENKITIALPSAEPAHLSISVTNLDIDNPTEDHIIAQLLVSFDLKGRIIQPAFYFENDENQKLLDLVMLTHGWRRINWKNIRERKELSLPFQREVDYHYFNGRVKGSKKLLRSKPIFNLVVRSTYFEPLTFNIRADSNGYFKSDHILNDSIKVEYLIHLNQKSRASLELYPSKAKIPTLSRNLFLRYAHPFDHSMIPEESDFLSKNLDELNVNAAKITLHKKMELRYPTGNFKGGNALSFDLHGDKNLYLSENIFKYLEGKIEDLQTIKLPGKTTLFYKGQHIQLFLDQYMTSHKELMQKDIMDFAYVKFIKPVSAIGPNHGLATLAVYSRKGNHLPDFYETDIKSMVINTNNSLIREFYSPDYSDSHLNKPDLDLRKTLFWYPVINLNHQQAKAELSFYNNDVSTAYKIVLEGITKTGKLIHEERIIRKCE